MDLALALKPLLLAQGFRQEADVLNADNTYRHGSQWRVTLDPGTEGWIAIWDDNLAVVCEARVESPEQAILLPGVFGFLKGVEVGGV
ncbi:MAG: hypothetical protein EHM35_19050 [Planctomycetaceae bacterium]|nr:MAG: hypothetical protein EHM35_19050 [Planctomycetaceae bacterium]